MRIDGPSPQHDNVRTSGYWSFLHASRPDKLTEHFALQQAVESARYAGTDMAQANRMFQQNAEELLENLVQMWPSKEPAAPR